MNVVDKALQTQIANIQQKTGKSLDELFAVLSGTGLEKHGQLRDYLKKEMGMGHGDANTVVALFRQPSPSDGAANPLDAMYTGAKEHLRPLHEQIMIHVQAFGPFEEAPKKAYISLRRKKQFAMVGPATKSQLEIGLNAKELSGSDRLVEQKPGGMCQYKVRLTDDTEIDGELIAWIRAAYDAAG